KHRLSANRALSSERKEEHTAITKMSHQIDRLDESVAKQSERMQALINNALASSNRELEQKYPFGYVLFGMVANGPIVYAPKLKEFRLEVDWENLKIRITNNIAGILFP